MAACSYRIYMDPCTIRPHQRHLFWAFIHIPPCARLFNHLINALGYVSFFFYIFAERQLPYSFTRILLPRRWDTRTGPNANGHTRTRALHNFTSEQKIILTIIVELLKIFVFLIVRILFQIHRESRVPGFGTMKGFPRYMNKTQRGLDWILLAVYCWRFGAEVTLHY